MKQAALLAAVFLFGMGAGIMALPLFPAQAEQWVFQRTAAVTQQSMPVGVTSVSPDNVKPSNDLYELIPEDGAVTETQGSLGRNVPEWAARNARSTDLSRIQITAHVRNTSDMTLKSPYWSVRAFCRVSRAWSAGFEPTMRGVQVAPGETDEFGTNMSVTCPPGSTGARFTVTYNEPGTAPETATIAYPW